MSKNQPSGNTGQFKCSHGASLMQPCRRCDDEAEDRPEYAIPCDPSTWPLPTNLGDRPDDDDDDDDDDGHEEAPFRFPARIIVPYDGLCLAYGLLDLANTNKPGDAFYIHWAPSKDDLMTAAYRLLGHLLTSRQKADGCILALDEILRITHGKKEVSE